MNRQGVLSLSEDAVAAMAALSELAESAALVPAQRGGSDLAVTGRPPRLDAPGLTSDEDRQLRRLHYLAGFGHLGPIGQSRYDELRDRDRRSLIRPPDDEDLVWLPRPRPGSDLLDWDAVD
jgi:hypothetical protein